MEQLQKKAGQLEDILAAAGVEKYAFRFVEKQTGEFNAEDEGFTLYRTLFDNDLRLTVFLGGRMGVASGNEIPADPSEPVHGHPRAPARDLSQRQRHHL